MSGVSRAALWVLDETLRLWFAADCLVCGTLVDRGPVCGVCGRWETVDPPWCRRCGSSVSQPLDRCGHCGDTPIQETQSRIWFEGSARDVIHQVKFSGRSGWLSVFRDQCFWVGQLPKGTVVVPVPLHPLRMVERGFNQSAVLAGWLAESLSLPLSPHGMIKTRVTQPQSGLSRDDRHRNLSRVFRWRKSIPVPESVLLVDDVFTTGSTLQACTRALLRAGTREVRAWTLTRTPFR